MQEVDSSLGSYLIYHINMPMLNKGFVIKKSSKTWSLSQRIVVGVYACMDGKETLHSNSTSEKYISGLSAQIS